MLLAGGEGDTPPGHPAKDASGRWRRGGWGRRHNRDIVQHHRAYRQIVSMAVQCDRDLQAMRDNSSWAC
jgi:hypothetical protein